MALTKAEIEIIFREAGLDELSDKSKKAAKSTEELEKATKKVKESAESGFKGMASGVNGAFKKVEGGIKGLDTAIKGLPLMGLIAAFGTLTAAVGGLVSAAGAASDALSAQNQSIQRMSMSIATNSKLTQDSNRSLMDFASSLQSATAFGDEFNMELISIGAQAGLNEDSIKRLTQVSLDLASKTGIDATQAMKQLSVGMGDVAKNIAVAEQAGIGFTAAEKKMLQEMQNTGKAAEATAYALEKIEKAVGGAAQKEIETYAGKQKQLANIQGDVREEFGRVVQAFQKPFLDMQTKAFAGFYDILKDPTVQDAIQKVVAGFQILGKAASWLVDKAFAPLRITMKLIMDYYVGLVTAVLDGAKGFMSFFGVVGEGKNTLMDFAISGLGFVVNGIESLIEGVRLAGDALGKLFKRDFEGAMASASAAGDSFKKILDPEAFKAKGEDIINGAKKVFEDVKDSWKDPIEPKIDTGPAEQESAKLAGSQEKLWAKSVDLNALSKKQLLDLEKTNNQKIKDLQAKMNAETDLARKNEFAKEIVAYEEQNKAIKNVLSERTKQMIGEYSKAITSVVGIGKDIANAVQNSADTANKALVKSLTDAYDTLKAENEVMLAQFDASIAAVNTKYEEMRAARAEGEEESSAVRYEQLEAEIQNSILSQDMAAQTAYQIEYNRLKKEADAKKKKDDEEKKMEQAKATEIKKLEDEKAKAAEEAARKEAMALYNKQKAEYDGNVANAKSKADMAIADAVMQPAMAALNAAAGVGTSFAQGGPIGAAVGLAMVAGIIGAVVAGVSGAVGAANNLKSIQGSAPQPPKFAIGTKGYMLGAGEEALVGEQGSEFIRNVGGGRIEVDNARESADRAGGGNVYNFTINAVDKTVSEMETMIINILNSMKPRDIINKI